MKRFIEAADREQSTLPECLDDWIDESNPVCVIDAFVQELNLDKLGFAGIKPAATGRLAYHPAALLELYIYGRHERMAVTAPQNCKERAMLSWNYQRPRPRSLAARKCGWHQSYRLRRTVYSSYQCANGHRHKIVSADKSSPATRSGG
jgi:hypothetical protein